MSLFFCLSGYLIVSIIYRNPDVVSFLTRRILRIVPAAVLYLLVVLVIVGVSLDTILSNLAFVTNYWNIGLDGPLPHMWSLSVEMHFYMAIALATLLLGRRAVWLIPIAAIAITPDPGRRRRVHQHPHPPPGRRDPVRWLSRPPRHAPR